jgi:hypothetical protein
MNYSISSRENGKNKKDTNEQSQRNGGRDDDLFGANTILNDNRRSQFDGAEEGGEDKISEFFNSKLPWDMTFAYSLTYGNNNREKQIIGNSIMISANTDLNGKQEYLPVMILCKRELLSHKFVSNAILSWRMDFNWTPFGTNANWGFFIGIKSGVLSDIKWDKRSTNKNR